MDLPISSKRQRYIECYIFINLVEILVYKDWAVHRLKPYGPVYTYAYDVNVFARINLYRVNYLLFRIHVAPQMMVHYTCNCIRKDTRQALGWVT